MPDNAALHQDALMEVESSHSATWRCHLSLVLLVLVNGFTWVFLGTALLVAVVIGDRNHLYPTATAATPTIVAPVATDVFAIADGTEFHNTGLSRAESLKLLFQQGVAPNQLDAAGRSVLWHAVTSHFELTSGNLDAIRVLLDNGADPNFKGMTGEAPLAGAIANGGLSDDVARDVVRLLLERGADPNVPSQGMGQTPLHLAVERGFEEVAQDLLSWGAEPNSVDAQGNTPLHEAIRPNGMEIAEILLNNGADPDFKNRIGQTPRLLGSGDPNFKAVFEKYPAAQ